MKALWMACGHEGMLHKYDISETSEKTSTTSQHRNFSYPQALHVTK